MVLQSAKDFTYLGFKGLLCFKFVDLAVHHIPSKSFETFKTSPNNCLLMIKVSLGTCDSLQAGCYCFPMVLT